MRILICDDHPVVRHGIKKDIAELMPGNNSADEAENGEQALELIKNTKYDMVLMDIQLPGKKGLEVLQYIKLKYPHLPVLMLSTYEDADYGYASFCEGAAGFLNKTVSPAELIFSIKKVAEGGKCFSTQVLQMIEDAKKIKKKQHSEFKHDLLTDYKCRLLKMFGEGKSNKAIAKEIHREEKTVSAHKSQIKSIMNFKDDIELQNYYNKYFLNKP